MKMFNHRLHFHQPRVRPNNYLTMLTIQFNGQTTTVLEGTTIEDLIQSAGIPSRFCAVERNLEIVPKNRYGATLVEENDSIEVVTLVGGG
jgi:thiamine biosynthesis protein ThiS